MDSLERLQQLLRDQPAKPPVERWQPELSGDMDLRIAADGEWYHEGVRIPRPALVKLFASILRREDDGHHYLVTPVEKWRIQVEDAPLLAVDYEVAGEGEARQLAFRLNTGEWVPLDAAHPLRVEQGDDAEPRPYLELQRGLRALISRAAFYRLVELASDGAGEGEAMAPGEPLVIFSHGQRFVLGRC